MIENGQSDKANKVCNLMNLNKILILLLVSILLIVVFSCGHDEEDESQNESEGNSSAGFNPITPVDDDDDAQDDDDDDDDLPGTNFPIVLMHGFFGWGEAGPLSYFSGVVEHLTDLGFEVFEPAVSPINSMETRAEQWEQLIEERFGDSRINIIAHSQGGLDARYMISNMGWDDRIGALVTISTPHRGTVLADLVVGLVPDTAEWIVDFILNLFDLDWDGFTQITREYVQNQFNPANPDDFKVSYYSYQADAGDNCFILLELTHWVINLFEGANDGIISVESARWGQEMGILSTDHWAIIGQPLGLVDFDHLGFYNEIATYLKSEGF